MAFWLHNAGTTTIELCQVGSSCDCCSVTLEKDIVEPGEKVKATAKVDLAHDPRFVGRLSLDARGYSQSNHVLAFQIEIKLHVKEDATAGE